MSDKILKRQSKYQGAKATDTLQMSQIHHLYTLCEENNNILPLSPSIYFNDPIHVAALQAGADSGWPIRTRTHQEMR